MRLDFRRNLSVLLLFLLLFRKPDCSCDGEYVFIAFIFSFKIGSFTLKKVSDFSIKTFLSVSKLYLETMFAKPTPVDL